MRHQAGALRAHAGQGAARLPPEGGARRRRGERHLKAFKAIDEAIASLSQNWWGLYGSYGVAAGAGGGYRFSASTAYDMRNWESGAYLDAGVQIGFVASITLSKARGIVLGKPALFGNPAADYGTIHNFFGGTYVGIAGSAGVSPLPLPFTASAGIALQFTVQAPPQWHPASFEVGANFSGGPPLKGELVGITGVVGPSNIGAYRLQGPTQGWVNVFDDVFGDAAFVGIPQSPFTAGNYKRMRHSPGSSDFWKGASVANSACRFADACELGAFTLVRVAANYAWSRMRALCP